MQKRLLFLVLILTIATAFTYPVYADGQPVCQYNADGSITCTNSGTGNGDNGGGGGGNPGSTPAPACTPNGTISNGPIVSIPDGNFCVQGYSQVDSCGTIVNVFPDISSPVACSTQQPPTSSRSPVYPCLTSFSVNSGGVFCDTASAWEIKARVTFPPISLDARPYPATLVRWDTALRLGDMPPSSGSGHLRYAPLGGGSDAFPASGDWRDITLTLKLTPVLNFVKVDLPNVGTLTLPLVGPTGNPTIFRWQVPSHPAAGGGPLAGEVGQLQELPSDFPLFVSTTKAPYQLSWSMSYYQWESACVNGPDAGGGTNCRRNSDDVFTGHREWGWRHHSDGGVIPPSAVQNLPASIAADLNGDGVADAYWDHHIQIRRMDDNNRIDNPLWAHTYSWGNLIFFGVREGQGQVGWPGSP